MACSTPKLFAADDEQNSARHSSDAFGNSAQLDVAHIISKAARSRYDLHARDHADYLF